MRTESRRYVLSWRAGWVRLGVVVWLALVVEFVGQSAIAQGAITTQAEQGLRFDHVVIVVEENKDLSQVIGNTVDTPYINQLASIGASFTNAHGEWHPSQPNYFALFSGSMQGIVSDKCPAQTPDGTPISPNQSLGGELLKHKYSFGTYSEQLPEDKTLDNTKNCFAYELQPGKLTATDTDPTKGNDKNDPKDQYARRHNPWISFTDVPRGVIQNWTDFPNYATDYAEHPEACTSTQANAYSSLPTVSFVVPNNQHEMHTASPNTLSPQVQQGDKWLSQHMSCYARWAMSHNSLLIVTWDEDGSTKCKDTTSTGCESMVTYPDESHIGTTPDNNIIPTIFVGAHVKAGGYDEWINHYNILRTLEEMYKLDYLGESESVEPITDVWQ